MAYSVLMEIGPEDRLVTLERFGSHLRCLRKARGLTQEALAMEAGFSRSYYSEIELGRRNISIINMRRLARALQVPLKALVDFDSGGCQ